MAIIKSIAASLPERRVSNKDIIDLVRRHSTAFNGDLEGMLETIFLFLQASGLEERRWCGRHESPIDHVAMAVTKVLNRCYQRRKHVELLIYVGVGRGFIEPGNSHMIANTLGFENAQCFDVVDSCMSWVRALNLVDSLFKSGDYRNALIINAEFNMHENGPVYPNSFTLDNVQQLDYLLPSFSLGEAATATLLIPNEPENFEFQFTSKPDLLELCTIPMVGYEQFCHPTQKMAKNKVMKFSSFGKSLFLVEFPQATKIFSNSLKKRDFTVLFVNASSKHTWDELARGLGVADKIHHVYPTTGNVVSASIPVAIHDAIGKGVLKRGDNIILWAVSAGMSLSATHLKY